MAAPRASVLAASEAACKYLLSMILPPRSIALARNSLFAAGARMIAGMRRSAASASPAANSACAIP